MHRMGAVMMNERRRSAGIDLMRIPAALLVIAIHTSPLTSLSVGADFFLTRVLGRTAVPFFFMVAGHFVLSGIFCGEGGMEKVLRYIRKLLLLYGCAILLYLPVGVYAGHYRNLTIGAALRMLFFDGTFYHLWYFPACVEGILLVCLLRRFLGTKGTLAVSCLLYIAGLLGDSYYGLTESFAVMARVYERGFGIWSYTRNGLFMAPVFLMLGALSGGRRICAKKAHAYVGLACSFIWMTAEAFTLRYFSLQRHDSMYLMLVPTMFFGYHILSGYVSGGRSFKSFGSAAAVVYIIHPAVIVAVRGLAKAGGIMALVQNSLLNYLCVASLSVCIAFFVVYLCGKMRSNRKETELSTERTWIELDCHALEHNVAFLRGRLPAHCRLMPALKADAYGHGAVLLARLLRRMGVDAFCVACVQEGIELRRAGIEGEILVLGYTHPTQFGLLRKWRLSQTVIDYAYAEEMKLYGKKLHVHVGIDTGMHRLGERCEEIERICEIFEMPNLIVDGVMTHLGADEKGEGEERNFTQRQAERFYAVLGELEKRGIQRPKIHLQASYGVLNYPQLAGDYARVGIALYGSLSTKEDTLAWQQELWPVLSLKTRVALVKKIHKGETAGYGLAFRAQTDMKIAVLAIGYADGLARSLSNGVGAALIRGKRAAVIGMICMDQTIVDVSGIEGVTSGDTAVIIGRSEAEQITAADLAQQTHTITNEVLSRLGARPRRILLR